MPLADICDLVGRASRRHGRVVAYLGCDCSRHFLTSALRIPRSRAKLMIGQPVGVQTKSPLQMVAPGAAGFQCVAYQQYWAFLCAPKMRDRTRAVLFLVIALTFGCVLGATAKMVT